MPYPYQIYNLQLFLFCGLLWHIKSYSFGLLCHLALIKPLGYMKWLSFVANYWWLEAPGQLQAGWLPGGPNLWFLVQSFQPLLPTSSGLISVGVYWNCHKSAEGQGSESFCVAEHELGGRPPVEGKRAPHPFPPAVPCAHHWSTEGRSQRIKSGLPHE